jgi:hypothetical protein
MNEERTRLRVKLGAAEIEYEGGTSFLKDEIMPAVSKILAMVEARVDLRSTATPLLDGVAEILVSSETTDLSHSTNTIATLLEANSATDLAIAAAAKLTLVEKKERMSRQEILDEMKTATSFFKSSFTNNHSNTLKVLLKADRLRLVAADTYALSHKERKELEALLADA